MSICVQFRWKLLQCFRKRVFSFQRSSSVGSYYNNPGTEPLQYLTIGQVANNAATLYGENVALISEHQNRSLTFNDAVQQADRLAAGLLELGLNPGDRLGLCSPNTIQWFITAIAAAKAGLIMVALNPAYVGHEMEYCMRKVGIKAIVMEETFKTQNYYKMLCKIAPEMENTVTGSSIKCKSIPSLSFVIVNSSSKLPGTFCFDDILQSSGSLKKLHEVETKVQADQASNIVFTSGTTGHPKGVVHSHFNITNNSHSIGKRIGYQDEKHKILVQTPFFHVFGLVIGICNAFVTRGLKFNKGGTKMGSTIVLPSASFKAEDSIKAIKKHKCSVLYGTPTMYVDLCDKVKQLPAEEQSKLKSPQIAISGGALCSPELFKKMIDCFNCNRVFSVYGQTECTAVSFQSTREDSEFLMTSTVGKLGEHIEMKVVDSKGNIVPMGAAGELYVRGYSLMLGYWDDEDKTKETITPERWLKTGDLFTLLEGGYGQVIGRIKDIIIRGGENISPKEVENFLETHPNILQAQVYGVKDERLGEEICCSIRLKEDQILTQKQVQDYCKGNIAHYKVPKYVEFVTDYPKTVSGKIQKYKLRKIMEEKLTNEAERKSQLIT